MYQMFSRVLNRLVVMLLVLAMTVTSAPAVAQVPDLPDAAGVLDDVGDDGDEDGSADPPAGEGDLDGGGQEEPAGSLIEQLIDAATAASVAEDASDAVVVDEPQQPVALPGQELVERRTARSRTFVGEAPDSYVTETFAAPIHYQDDDGNWLEIDNTLYATTRQGYAAASRTGPAQSFFAPLFTDHFLLIEADGTAISYSPIDATPGGLFTQGPTQVRYADAFGPSVDAVYDTLADGVKETLLLADPTAPNTYRFAITAPGGEALEANPTEQGGWDIIVPPRTRALYHLAAPTAVDNLGVPAVGVDGTSLVSMAIVGTDTGLEVSVTIDPDWLGDPARQFPVELDPTTTVDVGSDFFYEGDAARNYSGSLKVGANSARLYRSAIGFDLQAIPSSADVTSASYTVTLTGSCLSTAPGGTSVVPPDLPCVAQVPPKTYSVQTREIYNHPSGTFGGVQSSGLLATTSVSTTGALDGTAMTVSTGMTGPVEAFVQAPQDPATERDYPFAVLLRAQDESSAAGGPTFHSSRTSNLAFVPSMSVSWRESVVLEAPTTKRSNGATLTWSRYDGTATFTGYQIHRSAPNQTSFTPTNDTLLATITDRDVTTFVDTTAAANTAFGYRIRLVHSVGDSLTRVVTLPSVGVVEALIRPTADQALMTQITMVDGQTSCANYGASPGMSVGGNATTVSRGLMDIDADIAPNADITSALLRLRYTATSWPTARTIRLYPATASWEEGSGEADCTADGATWHDAAGGGLNWTAEGGDYDANAPIGTITIPAGSTSDYATVDIAGHLQTVAAGQRPGRGIMLVADDETMTAGASVEFRTDDYTTVISARPQLALTYTDGSRPIKPTVQVFAQNGEVVGTSLVTATATDDRRVTRVDFYLGTTHLGSDADGQPPYEFLWNSSTAPCSAATTNGAGCTGTAGFQARATDDAGNVGQSDHVNVLNIASQPPSVTMDAPVKLPASATYVLAATATDPDGNNTVARIEFLLDGEHFATAVPPANGGKVQVQWDTLDPAFVAYDGTYTLTARAIDNQGLTGQTSQSITIANTSGNTAGNPYQANISVSGVPGAITRVVGALTQEKFDLQVTVTNRAAGGLGGIADTFPADTTARVYWVSRSTRITTVHTATIGALAGQQSITVPITGIEAPNYVLAGPRSQWELHVDLTFDHLTQGANTRFSQMGNKHFQTMVTVHRLDGPQFFGLEQHHSYTSGPVGGGMQHMENVANGNVLWRWTPWVAPGRGLSTVLDFTYNSLERTSVSPAGNAVNAAISGLLPLGQALELHALTGNGSSAYVAFTDADGTRHVFDRVSDGQGGYRFEEPDGVELYLRLLDKDADGVLDCQESPRHQPDQGIGITRPDRVTFYFDCEGWPTQIADGNNNALTIVDVATPNNARTPQGPTRRVTSVYNTANANERFSIDYYLSTDTDVSTAHQRGRIKTITDHSGSVLSFTYYVDGNLRRITQQGGRGSSLFGAVPSRSWQFFYTNSSYTAPAVPGENGLYNAQSTAVARIVDPLGRSTSFLYDASGSHPVRTVTDRSGAQTSYTYNAEALTTRVSAPEGRESLYTFDTDGSPVSVVDAAGRTTRLRWEHRNLVEITDPDGQLGLHPADESDPAESMLYAYNDNGMLTSSTDQLGRTTTLTYDDLEIDDDDTGRHISDLTWVTRPEGVATSPLQQPVDHVQIFNHDAATGNLLSVTQTIDSTVDPIQTATTQWTYNPSGQITSITDPNGNATTINSYDLTSGQPTQVTDAEGRVTTFGYNDDGQLIWERDDRHQGTAAGAAGQMEFHYDEFHRPSTSSQPLLTGSDDDLVWSSLSYDANDNVTTAFNPAYGTVGRPAQGPVTRLTYDEMDRLVTQAGPDCSGNRLQDVGTIPGQTNGSAPCVVSELETVRIDYDTAGRAVEVTSPRGAHTGSEDRDDPLRPEDTDFETTTVYDLLDRPVTTIQRGLAADPIRYRHNCYDTVGNLIRTIAPQAALPAPDCDSTLPSHATVMDYTAAHELDTVTDPEGNSTSYDYDLNGRQVGMTDPAGNTTTTEYDERGLAIRQAAPYNGSRDVITEWEYDDNGWLVQLRPPRAIDADNGYYVTDFNYDRTGQRTVVALPTDGTLARTYMHTAYAGNGWPAWTSLPTEIAPGQLPTIDRYEEALKLEGALTYTTFFDTGWPQTTSTAFESDVTYTYTAEGWQDSRTSIRTLQAEAGHAVTYTEQHQWVHLADGQPGYEIGEDDQTQLNRFDANGNLAHTYDTIGATTAGQSTREILSDYNGFDELIRTRERDLLEDVYNTAAFNYDRNGNLSLRRDLRRETGDNTVLDEGRLHTFTYDTNDWVDTHVNHHLGQTTDFTFDGRGWETDRIITRTSNSERLQRSFRSYLDNGLPDQLLHYGEGTAEENQVAGYAIGYETNGIYLNGNRASYDWWQTNPDTTQRCDTPADSCIRQFTYNGQEQLTNITETSPTGRNYSETYSHSPSGNLLTEQISGGDADRTTTYTYDDGQRLTTALTQTPQVGDDEFTYNYFYGVNGATECVTLRTDGCPGAATGREGSYDGLVTDYLYDDFERLRHQFNSEPVGIDDASQPTSSATFTYDALDRVAVEQTLDTITTTDIVQRSTTYEYLGDSSQVLQEIQYPDYHPDTVPADRTQDYSYGPAGIRLAVADSGGGPSEHTAGTFTYTYTPGGDVGQLLTPTGVEAAYGYTAYGANDATITGGDTATGIDDTNPDQVADPRNSWRWQARHYDPTTGTIDMLARQYSIAGLGTAGANRFLQRDRYLDAYDDLTLSFGRLNANRYAYAAGNPITYLETDGHILCEDTTCNSGQVETTPDGTPFIPADTELAGGEVSTHDSGIPDNGPSNMEAMQGHLAAHHGSSGLELFWELAVAFSQMGESTLMAHPCGSHEELDFECGVFVPSFGGGASRGAVGFADDAVASAYQGMRSGGGHAMRHLMDEGLMPNSGSLASRAQIFEDLTSPILRNPSHSFDYRLGDTLSRAFAGQVGGRDVVVFVAKEGLYQGRVLSAVVPDANQLVQWGLR
jgi:YD repeat-containing protein